MSVQLEELHALFYFWKNLHPDTRVRKGTVFLITMLHFFDVYIQTRLPMTLESIHELEHRIFLIPELANMFDERHSKTNGMSYSRGIRFSLVTNRVENIEKMKAFFWEIHQHTLPEWTREERDRFDAEEQEWIIRQRQYFGSFAASVFEKKFDAINGIAPASTSLESLESMFVGIRFCENFSLETLATFSHACGLFRGVSPYESRCRVSKKEIYELSR